MLKIFKKLPKLWYQYKICVPLSADTSSSHDEKDVNEEVDSKFCLVKCRKGVVNNQKLEATVTGANKKSLVECAEKKFELPATFIYGSSHSQDSIKLPFTFEAIGLGFIVFLGLKHACINNRRYNKNNEKVRQCPGLANFLFNIVWAVRGSLPHPTLCPFNHWIKSSNVVEPDTKREKYASAKSSEQPYLADSTPSENAIPSSSDIRASLMDLAQQYTSIIMNSEGETCLQNNEVQKAVQYFNQASELGLDIALYNLGVCYETGTGVKQDNKQAFHYYMEAGKRGNSAALYNVAVCYMDGIGVGTDEEECVKYMRKASDGGIKEAQTYMGIHYGKRDEYDKAAVMFQKAVDQKYSEAEYFLGLCYEHGLGVDSNMSRAAELFSRASASGNTEATYRLANYYEQGLGGLTENVERALELTQKAADQGHFLAAEKLKCNSVIENVDESISKKELKTSTSSPDLNSFNQGEHALLSKSSSATSIFELSFLYDLIEEFKSGQKSNCSHKFYLEGEGIVEDELSYELTNINYNSSSSNWGANKIMPSLINA